MVSSSDVSGTEVYSPTGDHLGHIDHLMIDKVSGQVIYAVLTFGGFLGFGEGKHPLPWKKLTYNPRVGAFVTDITHEELTGAPSLTAAWFDDPIFREKIHAHYGVAP
jgi:sporulation protein YlmC with PRC-barrel domain